MNKSTLRWRYWRIITFFARIILEFIFFEIILRNLGLRKWVRNTRASRYTRAAKQFRILAIRMGGVMIKVGQFLSSRLDILPPEVTDELAGLQDEVPPVEFFAIQKLAETELGGKLEDKFEWFDKTPLAAASLGQVHRARLRSDAPEAASFPNVVVKIQRPFIEQLVEVDMTALRRVARWLVRYKPIRDHANVPGLTEEFASTVIQELDYLSEGKNAETFSANFEENPRIHVPRVVWGCTTRRVLTLEDVMAIKITDYAAISAAGIDRGEVARVLLDTYLQQIFEDGFFHADPHPGNMFVTPIPDETGEIKWKLTFVDFGMVGNVEDNLRSGLRELVIAVGTRDAARVVKAYERLDILLPGADLKRIEQAEAEVFDHFWGMSMDELRHISPREIRDIGHRFRDLMLEMPFQVPNNLLMLLRTIAILSGMCTGLDPKFNLWEQIAPYAQKLITEEATGNWKVWLNELTTMLQVLIALPGQSSRVLAQMEGGNLAVQVPQLEQRVQKVEGAINRLSGSVIFVGLLLAGVFLFNAGNVMTGNILILFSIAILVWTLFFVK